MYSVFQMFSIMLFIFRREFVNICDVALDVNQQWIGPNQLSYQQTMRDSFRSFVVSLSDILGETVRLCVYSYNFSILLFLGCCCCCCCCSFSVTNSLVWCKQTADHVTASTLPHLSMASVTYSLTIIVHSCDTLYLISSVSTKTKFGIEQLRCWFYRFY